MNVDLSRRTAKLAGTDAMVALGPVGRLDFADAVYAADSFQDLPKKYQTLILEAEKQVSDNPLTVKYSVKGSSKSGNYAHSGRQGKVGGSAPKAAAPAQQDLPKADISYVHDPNAYPHTYKPSIDVDMKAPTQDAFNQFIKDQSSDLDDGDYTVKIGNTVYDMKLEGWWTDCLESRDEDMETTPLNIAMNFEQITVYEAGWKKADISGYVPPDGKPSYRGTEFFGTTYIGKKHTE